jgi:hypothetical protein
MATIVNTPAGTGTDSGSGMGFLLGAILLIAFALLFFFYGLPYLGGMFQASAPQVNVPGQIDVNIQNPQGK